ncbi:MAG: hypothetical protein AB1898_30460 [Acidobacteriota bacterium]
MPAKRLKMRKLREVLRLRIEHELSDRAIGRSCAVSHRTVSEYMGTLYRSGLPWPFPEGLDDTTLERKLFPEEPLPAPPPALKSIPDMKYLRHAGSGGQLQPDPVGTFTGLRIPHIHSKRQPRARGKVSGTTEGDLGMKIGRRDIVRDTAIDTVSRGSRGVRSPADPF